MKGSISKEIINIFKLEPVMRISRENFILIADLPQNSQNSINKERTCIEIQPKAHKKWKNQ